MKDKITLKEKRFSFFADPQKRKSESLRGLHTLASRSGQPTNQNLPKSAILQPTKS